MTKAYTVGRARRLRIAPSTCHPEQVKDLALVSFALFDREGWNKEGRKSGREFPPKTRPQRWMDCNSALHSFVCQFLPSCFPYSNHRPSASTHFLQPDSSGSTP